MPITRSKRCKTRAHPQPLGGVGLMIRPPGLELQLTPARQFTAVGPLATRWDGARATRIGGGDADRPAPAPATVVDIDPAEVYAAQIRDELAGVMLDHSGSLALGPDDWLTVAASGAASTSPRGGRPHGP